MSQHTLHATQFIAHPIADVFDFFARPENLNQPATVDLRPLLAFTPRKLTPLHEDLATASLRSGELAESGIEAAR